MFEKLFVFLLVVSSFAAAAENPADNAPELREKARILVVYSLNSSNDTRQLVADGFNTGLHSKAKVPYTVESVELDVGGAGYPEESRRRLEPYLKELTAGEYDLVVFSGDPASGIASPYLSEIPERTAVLFANVSEFSPQWKKSHANSTGVIRRRNPMDNINLGLRIFPDTEEIMLLTSPRLWSFEKSAELQRSLGDKPLLKTIFVDVDDPDNRRKMAAELAAAPLKSFMVALDWESFVDNNVVRDDIQQFILENYRHPLFRRQAIGTDDGFGGVLARYFSSGELAGSYAARIIGGIPASALPVIETPSETVVSYPHLARFGVDPEKLPPNVRIINRPQPWHALYGGAVIYVAAAVALAAAFLLGAFFYSLRLRKRLRLAELMQAYLPVRVTVFDLDGNVLFFHREYGSDTKKSSFDYGHVSDFPWLMRCNLLERIRRVHETGVGESWDYDFYGEKRSALLVRLADELYGRKSVLAVSSDSSRLQEAYSTACDKAERLALTLQAIADGVIVTDREARVVLINQAACELMGCDSSEALGLNIDECFSLNTPGSGRRVPSLISEALATGEKVESRDVRVLTGRRGAKRFITGSAAPLRSASGDISGAIGVFRSEGDERAKLDVLKRNQYLLREVCGRVKIAFFRYNLVSGRSVPLISGLFFRPDDSDGRQIRLEEWLTPETMAKLDGKLSALRSGAIQEADCRVESFYGGQRRIYSLSFINSWHGNTDECLGVIHDMTGEAHRESSRREELELLNGLLDNLPYPVFAKDPGSKFTYVSANRAFCDHIGRPAGEICGRSDYELLANPAEAAIMREHDENAVAAGGSQVKFDESYTTCKGTKYNGVCIKKFCRLPDGRNILLCISVDITDERETVRRAGEAMEMMRIILDAVPGNIYVKDYTDGGRYVYWNAAAGKTFGVGSEIIGSDSVAMRVPEKMREEIEKQEAEAIRTGKTVVRRLLVEKEPAIRMHCDIYKKAVKNPEGHDLIVAMAVDMTERIRLDAEHQQKVEELFRHSGHAEMIKRCLLCIAEENDHGTVSGELLRITGEAFGADRCYIYGMGSEFFVRHFEYTRDVPSSAERYWFSAARKWSDDLRAGNILAISDTSAAREFAGSGIEADVMSLMCAPITFRGAIYGFIGIDYTRKQHDFSESDQRLLLDVARIYGIVLEREKRREEAEDERGMQSKVFEDIDVPMLLLDVDCRVAAVNHSACAIFGKSREEILGELYGDSSCRLRGEEHCSMEKCRIFRTLKTGESVDFESAVGDKTYHFRAKPVFSSGGEVRFVMLIVEDVEEGHLLQKRLSECSRALEEVNRRVEMERAVNRCLESLMLEDDSAAALLKIADLIGSQSGPCSVAAAEYSGGDSAHVRRSIIFGPSAGIRAAGTAELVREDMYPNTFAELKSGRMLHMNLDDLPVVGDELWRLEIRQYLQMAGQSEALICPIFTGRDFWGYLGVEHRDSGRTFSEDDLRLLQAGAGFFSLALEREKRHKALKSDECERDLIAELLPVPVVVADAEGNVLSANTAACNLSGLPERDLLGRPGRLLYSDGGDSGAEGDPLAATVRTGKSVTCERIFLGRRYRIETRALLSGAEVAKVVFSMTPLTAEADDGQDGTPADILVVDDVAMNLKVVTAMLRRLGRRAVCASSGAEAIELLSRQNFKCVITDLWMPEMSGVELAELIRGNVNNAGIKIFAVTADIESSRNFDLACFDSVLLKPLVQEQLAEAVGSLS